MSASLVGSEMCIRDRPKARPLEAADSIRKIVAGLLLEANKKGIGQAFRPCLLYTSDAADDM
eukprot:8934181-Alexandrium_andersonii.AAC.1